MQSESCPLCTQTGGELIWQHPSFRVIAVADVDYPGFTRVVWTDHVAEMTDLEDAQRATLMAAVYTVESVMRRLLAPDKVNLAAFGNMVPHMHWHVIPRWRDDRHFPDPYWAAPRIYPGQEPAHWQARLAERAARVSAYHRALASALDGQCKDACA